MQILQAEGVKSKIKKSRESQVLTSLSQNEHNGEVAEDGIVCTTISSDTVSLGRLKQHHLLTEVPGSSSFAFSFKRRYLAAINDHVFYKEITTMKIKRHDYILNLADELQNNYVSNKISTLSHFTPGRDDGATTSSKKRKKFPER
ncbi:hypothetical protein AVEN_201001-1 [Araneus ventricosus]|uniref:Uncharacterized protein n=1 Tax=Araneus ventricosus TaxID=182803 RepID=A0A4Y2PWF9_ARAVE|nr:hypothetical protein AVEN_201001-1 [Araneus ventricosus]